MLERLIATLHQQALTAEQLRLMFGVSSTELHGLEAQGHIASQALSNLIDLHPKQPDHKIYIPGTRYYE